MTTIQKRKILQRIVELESDLGTLRRVRLELATAGYSSASFSSGGGSKSYTRTDLGQVSKAIEDLTGELHSLRSRLTGISAGSPQKIITIMV